MERSALRDLVLAAGVGLLLGVNTAWAYLAVAQTRDRLTHELAECAARLGEEIAFTGPARPGVLSQLAGLGEPCEQAKVFTQRPAAAVAMPEVASTEPSDSLSRVTEQLESGRARVGTVERAPVLAYKVPTLHDDPHGGSLVVLLDASHLNATGWRVWRHQLLRTVILTAVVAFFLSVRARGTNPNAPVTVVSSIRAYSRAAASRLPARRLTP